MTYSSSAPTSHRPTQPQHVIRAGAASANPIETLATPDLPRGEVEQSELARTVLGDVAEAARAEANAQGYAVGWAQGRREAQRAAEQAAREVEAAAEAAEARRAIEHAQAIEALSQAAQQVRNVIEEVCTAIEAQSTDVAWALTEALMQREVLVASAPDVVRRVLALAPTGTTAIVRVPTNLAGDPALEALTEVGLTIQPDPNLGPADAMVEADGSVIDLRISAALERVKAVLR